MTEGRKQVIFLAAALFAQLTIFSQTTYTFTNCGASGRFGPTQSQVTAAYASTNLNGLVGTSSATSGIQTFTVPAGITGVRIEAWGAEGGAVGVNAGGKGARMRGDFSVSPGQVLNIVVGQQGLSQATNNCNGGGGGGGSFVYLTGAAMPMVVSGGGGGGHYFLGPGLDGTVSAAASTHTGSGGAPGSSGNGGGAGSCGSGWPGAGGAGWNNAGSNTCLWANQVTEGGQGKYAFAGGKRNMATVAGTQGQDGSFGGGGAAFHGAGGGGGYSGGGGGGSCFSYEQPLGGGGGSFNGGTNQSNSSGAGFGHGKVILSNFAAVPSMAVNILQSGNISCFGFANGALTASVVGGAAPFSYSWMPGAATGSVISGIPSGNYTVTVKDAGNATVSASYHLPQPAQVTANIAVTPIACNGGSSGSATVTPGGGTPPFAFSWIPASGNNSVAANLSPGNYTSVVTDANGCSKSTSFAISQAPAIAVSGAGTICAGQSLTLTASGANSYSWSTGSVTSSVVVSPNSNSVYTVTGAGCAGGTTVGVTVVYCSGTQNVTSLHSAFNLYPNPNNGSFVLESSEEIVLWMELFQADGRLIRKEYLGAAKQQISLQDCAAGIYFLHVHSGSRLYRLKVIRN